MKTLILALSLAVAACSSPYVLVVDPPVASTAQRVVDRHDSYVQGDSALFGSDRDDFLEESSRVEMLISLPEVSALALDAALQPVMARHDAYVGADASLGLLQRDIYLESTARLRALLDSVLRPVAAK